MADGSTPIDRAPTLFGRTRTTRYRTVKIDGKTMLAHRYIMEQHLGRRLRTEEHVHHVNGDTRDNRLENLELLAAADHAREHANAKLLYSRDKVCEVCGVTYTPRRSKRRTSRVCSWACRSRLLSRLESGRAASKSSANLGDGAAMAAK